MRSPQQVQTGISGLDEAPALSAEWIIDLQNRLGWQDRNTACLAMLATLHALRDYLPTDEVAFLGGSLPSLLRGYYYEGWHPREHPQSLDDRQVFYSRIHEALHRELGIDPDQVVRAVFQLLAVRITAPELEEVKAASPAPLHGLWPV